MKRTISLSVLLLLLIVAGVASYFCSFEVASGTLAFSQNTPSKTYSPGLHFKWPWDAVASININPAPLTVVTPIRLKNDNAEITWTLVTQITAPNLYLQHVGDATSLSTLIAQNLNETLKNTAVTMSAQGIYTLQNTAFKNLGQDSDLSKRGVSVESVLLSSIQLSDAAQNAINQNMQGLAGQIAQSIVDSGAAQAEQIRDTAEKGFLATEQQALNSASQMMGQGNRQAIQMLSPLYQQNPALFKAYVNAKARFAASNS